MYILFWHGVMLVSTYMNRRHRQRGRQPRVDAVTQMSTLTQDFGWYRHQPTGTSTTAEPVDTSSTIQCHWQNRLIPANISDNTSIFTKGWSLILDRISKIGKRIYCRTSFSIFLTYLYQWRAVSKLDRTWNFFRFILQENRQIINAC